ncbi:amino acid permease [Microthyrium microscopicum]|uniref:Amino acid permease n=1 Tax=Microthyrium microscopicum TaxID=703497 RepID=A0A6A6USE5_9PEZI|nr:amino acid permease [Microthyrium microscopicum]
MGRNEADTGLAVSHEKVSTATKLGISAESFQRRVVVEGDDQLNHTIKKRHLQMIAIGGSIGSGLFVGSGGALSKGGPASLVLGFAIIGVLLFNVVYALGEMAVLFPVAGSFYTYSVRFIDPAWGFAMGWNYVFQWAIVLPLELTVAALTVGFWGTNVNVGVWITVFLVIIVALNVFGVLGYAEGEFWASILKLSAVVIFLVIATVLVSGGAPPNNMGRFCSTNPNITSCYREYWGTRNWVNPGPFRNGFQGFCSVFVTAAFAYSGTELVGLAASESKNPAKYLPGAVKQVFWRIILFYVLALFFIGLLVRSDDDRLLGSGGLIDVNSSPFVIVAVNAGLKGFDSFINVIILISVVSIGMSGVYGGSRCLTALADQGFAPKLFSYVDKAGRPLPATALILAFGLLAYVNIAAAGSVIFDWLLALSGLATLFTWGSICWAHIRFRKAWKLQGHTLDEIPFRAAWGVYGSWLGLIVIFFVLLAQFYVAISPIVLPGKPSLAPQERAQSFFKAYLALPVVLLFYVCGSLWKGSRIMRASDIDIDTGRRVVDWEVINKERQRIASMGFGKRLYHKLF